MFYIYFLYSEKHDKYYVGYSDDPERRLLEHNTDTRMTFTHKFRPWILKAYYPVSENRGQAIKIERFIKKQKNKLFIQKIIENSQLFEAIVNKTIND